MKKKKQINKMRRDSTGAWVLPLEHEKEFMSGPIDFTELIISCLPHSEQVDIRRKLNDKYPGTVKKDITYNQSHDSFSKGADFIGRGYTSSYLKNKIK